MFVLFVGGAVVRLCRRKSGLGGSERGQREGCGRRRRERRHVGLHSGAMSGEGMFSSSNEGGNRVGKQEEEGRRSSVEMERDGLLVLGSVESLRTAVKKNRSDRTATYVQLATVEDGLPRVRTVVYRGLFVAPRTRGDGEERAEHRENANSARTAFVFCTDSRSNKVPWMARENARAEIAWYLPITREQYRLSGRVSLVDRNGIVSSGTQQQHSTPFDVEITQLLQERESLWERMSPPAKAQFFWQGRPGAPLSSEWPGAYSNQVRDGDVVPATPPPEFLLGLVWIESIDWLSLKRNVRTINGASVNP